MTEEINVTKEEKKECNCICKSEGFRNFLTIAIGSFVGVYFALSLFAALHKPPMMLPPCHYFNNNFRPHHVQMMNPYFNRTHKNFNGHFDRQIQKNENKAPFDAPRPVINR